MKEQKVVEVNAGLDSVPMRLTVDSVTGRDKGIDAVDCSVTSLCDCKILSLKKIFHLFPLKEKSI